MLKACSSHTSFKTFPMKMMTDLPFLLLNVSIPRAKHLKKMHFTMVSLSRDVTLHTFCDTEKGQWTNHVSFFLQVHWYKENIYSHSNNLVAYQKKMMLWSLRKKLGKNKQMASIISPVCAVSLYRVSTTF